MAKFSLMSRKTQQISRDVTCNRGLLNAPKCGTWKGPCCQLRLFSGRKSHVFLFFGLPSIVTWTLVKSDVADKKKSDMTLPRQMPRWMVLEYFMLVNMFSVTSSTTTTCSRQHQHILVLVENLINI